MSTQAKTLEFKIERTISATTEVLFDAWLSADVPGTPWNPPEKFLLNPKVDGMFYWTLKGTPHYGRFTEFNRPARMQHTWMSPGTLGQESTVTVTFEKQGDNTRMTLVHSNLPDHEVARGHDRGWNYFLGLFREQYGDGSRKKFDWDEVQSSNAK